MNIKNQHDRNLTIPFLAAGLSAILAQTCKAWKQGRSKEYVYCDLPARRSLSPNESEWISLYIGGFKCCPSFVLVPFGRTHFLCLVPAICRLYYKYFIVHYFACPSHLHRHPSMYLDLGCQTCCHDALFFLDGTHRDPISGYLRSIMIKSDYIMKNH